MKKHLSFLLALSFLVLPLHSKPKPQPKPQWVIPVVCGLVVLGVGVVVVFELHKTCVKVFGEQPVTANTNAPPNQTQSFTGTGQSVPVFFSGKGMALNDYAVSFWDASAYGWLDPKAGLPVNGCEQFALESSYDFRAWREEYTVQLWASDAGCVMLYSKAGSPMMTNYLSNGTTNYVALSIGTSNEPAKFFRIKPL